MIVGTEGLSVTHPRQLTRFVDVLWNDPDVGNRHSTRVIRLEYRWHVRHRDAGRAVRVPESGVHTIHRDHRRGCVARSPRAQEVVGEERVLELEPDETNT